ncbi:hypothetical protein MMC10_007105 [Thelotrema lepadinum]|nr:hypothetical protein [Thelotrema lepadinum]
MDCLSIGFWRSKRQKRISKLESEPKVLPKQTQEPSQKTSTPLRPFIRRSLASCQELIPIAQHQLLLSAPKEAYTLVEDASTPKPSNDREVVIQIQTIGLNPIDWKGPAYNFGLPSLPCVLGRDYVGIVLQGSEDSSRIRPGDIVLGTSTDYRDYRKAAFQQFAIAKDYNLCRLPESVHVERMAAVGVAFVTAAITLGVCLGLRFRDGPDLYALVRSIDKESLPEDIRDECRKGVSDTERLQAGDWLAIWGAGSTIGFFALQIAKLSGVRVACVADAVKRGSQLVDAGADVLVHRAHTDEAKDILRTIGGGNLRFGIDTVGKESAALLQETLRSKDDRKAHIAGLTGLPKSAPVHLVQHKVPIKLFHEQVRVGEAIMVWMEELFSAGKLALPEVDIHPVTGLGAVNGALNRLKTGELAGQRIIVRISDDSEAVSANPLSKSGPE